MSEQFSPGQRVTWLFSPPTWPYCIARLRFRPQNQPATIVSIGKRTAHIETRRKDGRLVRRYVKLATLRAKGWQ